MTSFWHPFATMGTVDGHELMIDRGDGVYVWDESGTRYLDGTASLWYANVGYGRAEIADAVTAQLHRLPTFHTFTEYANRPAVELAERIAAVAPDPASKVFFGSGGSDAIDTAGKLARRYFHELGQPERKVFIVRDWGYHGVHGFGTSLAGMGPNRDGYGPLIDDVVRVPYDSIEALEQVVAEIGADRIAALFTEPVIGAGGVRPVSAVYLKESRRIIRDAGALYIADEVITGFGRVGDWFASSRFGLEPDLITFAKGVTSGYQPLGGVIAAAHVAVPFWAKDGPMWRHGYTYSGHAAACAAGLANLAIIERERLPQRVLALEAMLTEKLHPLLELDVVTEVRSGVGLLAGVQLDADAIAADPSLPGRAAHAIRDRGVLTRVAGGGTMQVSPPLIITEQQLDELAAGHYEGIASLT